MPSIYFAVDISMYIRIAIVCIFGKAIFNNYHTLKIAIHSRIIQGSILISKNRVYCIGVKYSIKMNNK
jgi:hypothetical protein